MHTLTWGRKLPARRKPAGDAQAPFRLWV